MVVKFNQEPSTNFDRLITEIGNGNYDTGIALINAIALRLIHARAKHPDNGGDFYGSINAIKSELAELETAICRESRERQHDEALDVLATTIRFINKEYEK